MPRKSTTQWEFNNLFPDEGRRQIFSVSELTRQVKRLLEERIGLVWVSGEISGLKLQSSGHIYFTLKDEFSQIQCVLFRGEDVEREILQDGIKVLVQGDLTVYEPRGVYQIVVKKVEMIGAGALQIAFEKLKKKLQSEGLFSKERKRKIPLFPKRIGIVTSPTGAALRDILHIIGRRYAGIEIILAPCKVQGEGAGVEIASAINLLNEYSDSCPDGKKIDVILVTRGGGSIEDLWAFNEEIVARAVFSSAVPIISAVGHEIDFTICDFVADLRAATPSAAAEILTANYVAAKDQIIDLYNRLTTMYGSYIEGCKRHFQLLLPRFFRLHPQKYIQEHWQYLDDLQSRLNRPVKICLKDNRTKLNNLIARLIALRPINDVKNKAKNISDLKRRLNSVFLQSFNEKRSNFINIKSKIELLSPEGILKRGYSITIDSASKKIIKSVKDVKKGQAIKTNVSDGAFDSTVQI
ncbi:MAG TPA: exodeoxyribonuclease VII large subunit [Verrucomicrobiota bacterium]|nr:exodeoxyribonuclease VII large subunit [Verrucomicrobiota bacterium]